VLSLARFAIGHRRLVVASWIVVLVAGMAVVARVGNSFANSFSLPNTDSQRAYDLLKARFPAQAGDADQIVFHTPAGRVTDPSVRAVVAPMLARVATLPHVSAVVSPYSAGGGRTISRQGTIGFATVTFDRRANQLPRSAISRVIHTAQGIASPALQVELGGQAIEQTQAPSIGSATAIGIGAAIVVLLISFGSVLAAGLPVLTALFGLGTGLGLIALATRVIDMVDFSSELALMIGLGVGIDYALFIVTRYREAYRANGGDVAKAVELAMNTAGRAILFAGATVVIALMGMFALGVSFLYGVAIASSIAVLLVLAASLTLLPALLTFIGRRIGAVRAGRRGRPRREYAFWERWTALVQRHAVWAALGATAFMLLLAAPALGLRLGASDAGNDQPTTTTHKAYELLARGFGKGFNGPLLLAVELPRADDAAALERLRGTLLDTPGIAAVSKPRVNAAGTTASLVAYPTTAPQSAGTTRLVEHIRGDVIPAVERATGANVYIGGTTATQVDFSHVLSSKLPLFIAIVIALSALLLLIVFRSLLIPVQAALMNLLSIAASLGIVQAVFERGWLGGLFGVQAGPIEAFIPVMVFAIVFGLSMDYEVFLISRIHEEWVHRDDASAAVRKGLTRTGRVITAAAAVMVVVFASFAASSSRILQLFGLALGSAVFLDAVVIRTILLPAVLQLLGRHSWWLPDWLQKRLPRLTIEPEPNAADAPAAAAPSPGSASQAARNEPAGRGAAP
jgi:RND superfamily putative drug exporter